MDAGTEPSGLFSLNGILNRGLGNAWACAPFFIGLKCDAVYLAVMICDSQRVAWLAALWGRERASPLPVLGPKKLFLFFFLQFARCLTEVYPDGLDEGSSLGVTDTLGTQAPSSLALQHGQQGLPRV